MSREIPQFVACGLELGNCPRQIPYDMANHDKQIRDGVIDRFAKEMKDLVYKWFESGVIVTSKIDKIAEKMKGAQNERA